MIKPLRFTEENCKKILEEIKRKTSFSEHSWSSKTDALLVRFKNGRELSLIHVDNEIVYSHYVAFFAYSEKRWPTQAEMYVTFDQYEDIVKRALVMLRIFSLDDGVPFPKLTTPIGEEYAITFNKNRIGLEEFRLERLSNAVYGHSHEDMQTRIGEDIRELKSKVPQKLVPLDSAIELVTLREKEIMELRLEIESDEEKIETMAKEKEEEVASAREETAADIWRTLLEDTHQYLKQEDDKSLTRTIRDYLHHVVRDKKYQDAINKIGVATDDKWDRLIAAIEKPKINIEHVANIERVNDIHGNDHVEAGL